MRCRWQAIGQVEDALALLSDVQERQRVITRQAWRQGSFEAIFEEATAMERSLVELRRFLSDEWQGLVATVRGG